MCLLKIYKTWVYLLKEANSTNYNHYRCFFSSESVRSCKIYGRKALVKYLTVCVSSKNDSSVNSLLLQLGAFLVFIKVLKLFHLFWVWTTLNNGGTNSPFLRWIIEIKPEFFFLLFECRHESMLNFYHFGDFYDYWVKRSHS